MYATIITFSIALLGIILMLVLKHREIKTGKKSLLSRAGDDTDHIFQAANAKVRFFISHINKRTFIALVQWVAFHVLSFFRNIYLFIHDKAHRHPHSKKVIDMVTGKVEPSHNGGASFYLKQIAKETKK